MSDREDRSPELMASVPVGELRKLADLLHRMDPDLADDLLAGLANRLLRDLTRRWADTVSVWALEAELWSDGAGDAAFPVSRLGGLSEEELSGLVRESVRCLARRKRRPPAAVLAGLLEELGREEEEASPDGPAADDRGGRGAS